MHGFIKLSPLHHTLRAHLAKERALPGPTEVVLGSEGRPTVLCAVCPGGRGVDLLLPPAAPSAREGSEKQRGRPCSVLGFLVVPEAFSLPKWTSGKLKGQPAGCGRNGWGTYCRLAGPRAEPSCRPAVWAPALRCQQPGARDIEGGLCGGGCFRRALDGTASGHVFQAGWSPDVLHAADCGVALPGAGWRPRPRQAQQLPGAADG